jgi:hypothetical protein
VSIFAAAKATALGKGTLSAAAAKSVQAEIGATNPESPTETKVIYTVPDNETSTPLIGGILGSLNDVLAPDFLFGEGATVLGLGAKAADALVSPALGSAVGNFDNCLQNGGICGDTFKGLESALANALPNNAPKKAVDDYSLVSPKLNVDTGGLVIAALVIGGIYLATRKK